MTIPLIDLSAQHRALGSQIKSALARVIDRQTFINGPEVRELESKIAKDLGVRHVLAVGSGSDAIFLVLQALGIGPGDEVITTAFSFFATAGSISRLGAKPVFVDIDPHTFNIDPSGIASEITRRTKAILPVHLFGLCADMDAILRVAKKHGIPVIEDAAQAYGASYKGREAGSMGLAGCFSFYPTKNFGGAGDGGFVTTSSDAIASKIRLVRDHGSKKKYYHEVIGMNSRLDTMQAAVLLVKFKHVRRWNQKRAAIARAYERAFRGLPVETPPQPAGYRHVYHLYSILTDRRDPLAAHLTAKGIGCGVYYPLALHLQPCYRSLKYRKGDLPETDRASARILSIPVWPEMSDAQTRAVTAAVQSFFRPR